MGNFLFRVYPKYKWALAFNDFLVFHFSFLIALKLRYMSNPDSLFVKQYFEDNYLKAGVIIYSVLCIYYYQYCNLYKIQNIFKSTHHAFLIFKSLIFVVLGFIVFHFLFFYITLQSRGFFLLWFVILGALMMLTRIPFVKIISANRFVRDRIVIIGAGFKGKRFQRLIKHKIKFKEVIGFLDDSSEESVINGIPVLGKIADAEKVKEEYKVDYFFLAIDNIKRDPFFEVFKEFQAKKLPLYISSKYLRTLYEKLNLDMFDEFGMVRFNSQLNNKLLIYLKRIFDIIFSLVFIILFSPVLIFLALAIKFTSKGNIIYKQIRIGKHGKPFYFYKFRSMYVNSDKDKNRKNTMEAFIKGEFAGEEGSTKIVNTANITPIGKFIRKYSLDELPQLFNVLIGEMSLVGPRPCVLSEWKIYEKWQKYRLDFVPGCTGVWQVCGRSEVNFEESVLMDIYYNQNHSLWFDFKIMLKTVSVVFTGKGGA